MAPELQIHRRRAICVQATIMLRLCCDRDDIDFMIPCNSFMSTSLPNTWSSCPLWCSGKSLTLLMIAHSLLLHISLGVQSTSLRQMLFSPCSTLQGNEVLVIRLGIIHNGSSHIPNRIRFSLCQPFIQKYNIDIGNYLALLLL